MSTRCYIGKLNPDDSISAVYCHWDGYPEWVGKILTDHYTDEEKLDKLLELGQVSSLGPEIGEKHDFNDRNDNFCTFYGRDRGESDTGAQRFSSLSDYINEVGVDYHYIFGGGKWRVFSNKGEIKL